MTKLAVALQQLANKAANGDLKAIKDVIALYKEIQAQEPYLNAPTFQVNFVKLAGSSNKKRRRSAKRSSWIASSRPGA
jgi:hypothetical protein